MHPIDWLLVAVPLLIVAGVGIYTHRYMKSVADFMSGGRLAGRYLLAVSRNEMEAGAVVFVSSCEVIAHSGFTLGWWTWINAPIGLIVGISGFVIYRYRETRAMTLAQFFEIRYSRSIRIFTGILAFVAGCINFGIIPAVGARFFVYFLGLPPVVTFLSWNVPTYIPLMAISLSITLMLALGGGLLTVMMTDCIEGVISQLLYLVIIASLLSMFHWTQISAVLANQPRGQSLLNPFDSMGLKDFNLTFVLMGTFVGVYGTMAWQNKGAYNSASLTAHESRMGGILGSWRGMGRGAVITLLAICAMTYLAHPDFAAQSAGVEREVARIPQAHIQEQMRIPIALAHLLPPGIKGALCVVLLMGIFGTDSAQLHAWGGILVQDVLVPMRKEPFDPARHIRVLRLAMCAVAVFAFIFGILFRQMEFIAMWWSITQTVYIGGAGAAIIGGLYWKKGTAAGAWSGLIAGSTLSLSGIMARQVFGERFPLNPMEISFCVTLIAIALYVGISLLTAKEDFNMERMLHRGPYAAIKAELGEAAPAANGRGGWLGRLIGFDENFTAGDKWIAGLLFGWGMIWFTVFIVGTAWNLVAPWPLSVWSGFWHIVAVGLPVLLAVVTGVWFTWGGLRDMRDLFRRLREQKIDPLDNGVVVGHQNLDEAAIGATQLTATISNRQQPLEKCRPVEK